MRRRKIVGLATTLFKIYDNQCIVFFFWGGGERGLGLGLCRFHKFILGAEKNDFVWIWL